MPLLARFTVVVRTLHWQRGLRAGISVGMAMVVCRMLHRPMGWAALGGFEAVLVDNGGPYRSRLNTIATVLLGGALCGIIGTMAPQEIVLAAIITAAVCFAVTFARVAAQPFASTAVVIMVIYFAGFGAVDRTWHGASANALAYILGGIWSGVLSLFLWPVDPFRPARLEVAESYELLAAFAGSIHVDTAQEVGTTTHAAHDDDHPRATDFKRQLRQKFEAAREALGATAARAPARTIRARNLSVLLETADMLFAASIRLTEIGEAALNDADAAELAETARWLSAAERAIAANLREKPADNAASFGTNGSHRLQFVRRRAEVLEARHQAVGEVAAARKATSEGSELSAHLQSDERETLENISIAFEALRAVWTGYEMRPANTIPLAVVAEPSTTQDWVDSFRENWTFGSIMMRHALRMAVVGAVDVVLIRTIHITHGFWLAMTSIIVLQPYGSGTVRKSMQRVGGTVGGGILAALLAASIHSESGIIAVITACSVLTLATYAIDYGWYSFFLTPTFVLLSLPYLRDWRYAGVRIVTTLMGAVTAIVAMRMLWPQNLDVELSGLLARSASASAEYVRAVLQFWQAPAGARRDAERTLLAPARRTCGLTSHDAEEALDRLMLEPGLPLLSSASAAMSAKDLALSFTTYSRRFAQCVTTLASAGGSTVATVTRLTELTGRLDTVAQTLAGSSPAGVKIPASAPASGSPELDGGSSLAEQMLQRMERQTGVLERVAAGWVSATRTEPTSSAQPNHA
jgi:uncharacterized membrane protein YccC